MYEIKSVAIAGGSGNLGQHILKATVDAGYEVTILTRLEREKQYGPGIRVVEVDYTSKQSLTAALQRIDALVSTTAAEACGNQIMLIDAAIAAGVKRFVPSEYGSCTTSPKVEAMPVYASAYKIKHYLEERTAHISWTVLAPGAFLEFLFGPPIVLNYTDHSATLFDEGDNRFSSTSMPQIGKAIVGILKNFEASKNKVVRASEIILTQNMLLKIAKELRPHANWTTRKVSAKSVLEEGLKATSAGDFSVPSVMKVITGTAFAGDKYGAAYDENDNELLGVTPLQDSDLRGLVAGRLT